MSSESGDRVRSSVKVALVATIVSGIVQATTMVVLARLLEPRDYGFFVVCLSINALTIAFLMSGIERAMVIEPDEAVLEGRALPLVLILLVLGAVAVGICAFIRHMTGWAIDLRVLAIMLGAQALSGVATVPRAMLRKHLSFMRIVTGEVVGQVCGNLLTAAALAVLGFGVFSLTAGFAVGLSVSTLFVLTALPRSLRGFKIVGLSSLAHTAGGVFKPASVEALNGQISPLVVSSLLGPISLGLFNRVYTIVTLPVQLMVSSLNRVMISALVSVSADLERRRRGTNLMLRMAAALITPLTFGIAASGPAFVATMLGPKWASAAMIIPFLAVAVWANMIAALLGQLAESVRRFNEKTKIQFISTAVLVGALLVGSMGGMTGIAIGVMISALFLAALYIRLAATIIEVPVKMLLIWLVPGVIAGIACASAALIVAALLTKAAPPFVLSGQIAASGAAAIMSYLILDRVLICEISRTLMPRAIDRIIQRQLSPRVQVDRSA